MKKILSLVLAFAMIFTLAAPVGATTISGNGRSDVSGSFDPTVSISGIALVDTEDDDITYDEENKQYIVDVSADDEIFAVNFMASGTGLNYYASEEDVKLRLTSVTEDGETAETVSLKEMGFSSASEVQLVWEHELKVKNEKYVLAYSNNGGETWNDAVTIIPRRIYLVGYSNSIENGSVSLSKGSAAEGETITVTATPADGYRLTKLTYTTITDGTETAITANADGDYTFEMPADDVNVTATFSKLYEINIKHAENGTITADKSTAVAGETVTLSIHGNAATETTPEYKLAGLTVMYYDDEGNDYVVEVLDGYKFVMPEHDVEVYASFESTEVTYKVDIYEVEGNGNVEADPSEAAEGDTITLTATPHDSIYYLTSIKVTDPDGNEQTLTKTGENTYTFTMPAKNVNVYATFALIEAKWGTDANNLTNIGTLDEALAAAKADSNVAYIQLQTDWDKTIEITGGEFVFDMNGKTIDVPVIEEDEIGIDIYYATVTLRNGTVKGFDVVCIDQTAKVIIESGTYQGDSAVRTWGDLEIQDGTFIGDYSSVSVYSGCTATISGGSFSATYRVIDLYGTVKITGGTFSEANYGTFYYDDSAAKIDLSGYGVANTNNTPITDMDVYNCVAGGVSVDFLTLPANYALADSEGNVVTVMANSSENYYIVEAYTITVEAVENGTVTPSVTKAKVGATVTLTVKCDDGYELSSIVVTKDSDSATVSFDSTGEASGIYTFTMPASNVTVTATFTERKVTSASITWGSLSFTYDDTVAEGATAETGWVKDTTDGAGTVTVENTGDTAFTATATYNQAEGYTEIYGYFDTDAASPAASKTTEVAVSESCTFTLTLSGKPEKAIEAGTPIGSVTITFEAVKDANGGN